VVVAAAVDVVAGAVEVDAEVLRAVTVTARPTLGRSYSSLHLNHLTHGSEQEKQAAHGWGATDGDAELADEQAGDAIAKQDEKAAVAEDAAPETEAVEEDKTKSYDDYLAELAEKKLAVAQNLRKANEGSSKKFPEGTAVTREEEADFMAGSGGKAKKQKERKDKTTKVQLEGRDMIAQAPREGNFGGRGRGGRGRGEGRGDRGGRGGRGRGEGRGDRGDRGDRGEGRPRGGRGGQSGPTPNLSDASAFPSLGS
jgi:plasminogen activator inhibitor 1 RNA-binding protein